MQLYEAVVQQHAALAGLPQAAAEEQYILLTQRLDGYGQETFLTRDSARNEAVLGVSLTGSNADTIQRMVYKAGGPSERRRN